MQSSSKVLLNTGILYSRMFLTIGITLYSTRIVLNALGATDFGIFNLVAGVIMMLSFLNAAMTTSTQRYLSYYQGRNDFDMQKKVFFNSLVLHLFMGVIIVIALELAGILFFETLLNIPANKIYSAKVIYHLMSATVFFTIMAVPFNGSLVAHENMLWVAIVSLIETFLKLGIAFSLNFIQNERLVWYGVLTESVSMISLILYSFYCFTKYQECSLSKSNKVDGPLIKQLSSFAGWNLFGALCGLGKTQGVAVLLNVFFGATINAAYGIANQISGQLNNFSPTMLRALNPQIMKSEGLNNRGRMVRLSYMASKYGFSLLAIIAIPCIFEMTSILKFWLKNVPDYTVVFSSLILIAIMVNQLTIGLDSAAQANGNIKRYMLIVGSIKLAILPVSCFLLKNNFQPYSVMIAYMLLEGVAGLARLYVLNYLVGITLKQYLKNVIGPIIFPVVMMIITCFLITKFLNINDRFLITLPISIVVFIVAIYFTGLSNDERKTVTSICDKFFKRYKYAFKG